MNKAERKEAEWKNRRLYKTPQSTSVRPLNAVFINPTNTLKHELAKTIGAYCLRKAGDIPQFNSTLKAYLLYIQKEVNELIKDFPKEQADFITEAVPIDEKERRVDLVRLWDNARFEFESKTNIKKEGAITILI